MDSRGTEAFARRSMHEVWKPFKIEAVPRFYHHDVVGHHRTQTLTYEDILNRLAWDQRHSAAPVFDIRDSKPKQRASLLWRDLGRSYGGNEQDP